MTKVFVAGLYLRLSDKDKNNHNESCSITNQRALLMQYINQNHYILGDVYIDDGFSGSNFNRPAYQRLIKDIENGKINMVITKDMSRLGRDYIEVGNLIEKYFPCKNIRYIAIDDNIDTFLDNNNDIMPFKSLLNELYARDISKKIKSSIKARQREGKYISGKGIFGYDIDKNNKYHLVINEEQAKIVRYIFDLCIQGKSLYNVAQILTNNNIPTPSQFKSLKTNKYKIGIWSTKTIRDILTNEMYLGHMVQNKRVSINHKLKKTRKVDKKDWIIVKNTHEPIIDLSIFDQAQKLLSKNNTRCDKKEKHLFDGLLYCYECGHKISIQSRRKQDNNCYILCNYYRSTRYRKCSSHSNNYDKLESIIIEAIKKLCIGHINKEKIISKVLIKINNEYQKDFKTKIKLLEKEISVLNHQIEKIYFDKLNNKIDDVMFGKINNKVKEDLEYNKNKLKNIKQYKHNYFRINKKIDSLFNDLYNKREFLMNIIDKILIHNDKRIDIIFSFKCL